VEINPDLLRNRRVICPLLRQSGRQVVTVRNGCRWPIRRPTVGTLHKKKGRQLDVSILVLYLAKLYCVTTSQIYDKI
jgi:hypothetical protein